MSKPLPPLRGHDTIQWAHDLIALIVFGDVPLDLFMTTPELTALHFGLDVLCWVLHHDHNESFNDNLRKLYQAASVVAKFPKPENGLPWE